MNIELNGITKRFGGTQALDGVDLRVAPGTVHALVGENGAGKSTLGKVIAGVITPDEGTYNLAGRVERFSSPRQALEVGVTMMAQELSLVPARSVIENVFLGIESKRGIFVRSKDLDRRYAALVEQTGIVVPGRASVGSLTVGDQQKVEILRALARDASVIVMDEPTARLTGDETQALMVLIRRLADSGKTIIFVSHFLTEVLEIADFVTVMRDGKVVRTSRASEESEESLIEGMTGRSFNASFPERQAAPGASAPIVLSVAGLGQTGAFADVTFNVRAGEIVAITGLVGSGRSEVLHAIYGDTRPSSGSVELMGKAFMPSSPGQALSQGLALVPESRKDQGLFLNLSVEANVTMSCQSLIRRKGLVSPKLARQTAQNAADAVGVKAESISTPISALSGGNQQKALFARALLDSPTLLLADEPTRGVDVAAKRAIYDLLVALASGGMAILMVSSETEEVLGLAHRILVMHEGRIVTELNGTHATEEDIMTAAFSSSGPTS